MTRKERGYDYAIAAFFHGTADNDNVNEYDLLAFLDEVDYDGERRCNAHAAVAR